LFRAPLANRILQSISVGFCGGQAMALQGSDNFTNTLLDLRRRGGRFVRQGTTSSTAAAGITSDGVKSTCGGYSIPKDYHKLFSQIGDH
jgi:hypothetical protein